MRKHIIINVVSRWCSAELTQIEGKAIMAVAFKGFCEHRTTPLWPFCDRKCGKKNYRYISQGSPRQFSMMNKCIYIDIRIYLTLYQLCIDACCIYIPIVVYLARHCQCMDTLRVLLRFAGFYSSIMSGGPFVRET